MEGFIEEVTFALLLKCEEPFSRHMRWEELFQEEIHSRGREWQYEQHWDDCRKRSTMAGGKEGEAR